MDHQSVVARAVVWLLQREGQIEESDSVSGPWTKLTLDREEMPMVSQRYVRVIGLQHVLDLGPKETWQTNGWPPKFKWPPQ